MENHLNQNDVQEIEEDDLICAVQAGDLAAFEQLIHLHSSRVRAFVSMRLPVSHLVDEIAHEAFVFAYRHMDDFTVGSNFGAWLRAIANNLVRAEVLRYSRSVKNQQNYLEHCLVESSQDQGLKPESPMVLYLEECLGDLPEGQRELLQRRYKLSESTRDMAQGMDQSEAWVRTTLCRVRRALRACVEHKQEVSTVARG
ncbi:MAG: sigma-70 family RNA polymerase sigma factor [Verrucomicrobiales bacterium]|nr:sigma-70 family RNA polymerase sigma factor [Verrucomicrobiales bacterium]